MNTSLNQQTLDPKTWQSVQKRFPEANFLQSPAWEKTNQLIGHRTFRLKSTPALLILKSARRARYLELPGGPLIDWQDQQLVKELFSEISKLGQDSRAAFVRIRPQLDDTLKSRQLFISLGLKLAPMHLHAEHTTILDLSLPLDQLLANMRRQTRYEIRRSEKLKIPVFSSNDLEIFKLFHQIQSDTASRQNFIAPDLKTLLAERSGFAENARIYYALTPDSNSDPTPDNLIAMALVIGDQTEMAYFEAASTPLNRQFPGAYALQWQIIQDLKRQDVKRYNLWGIAPPNQPEHRYAKVTTFKTGFGGKLKTFLPAHDLVLNQLHYLPNLLVEKLRKKRRHL